MDTIYRLSDLLDHPLSRTCKFGVTAKDFSSALLEVNKNAKPVVPDTQAIRFYALNQIAGVLRKKFTKNEALPDWAVEAVSAYITELESQHARMVSYTFLVISREWRHLKNLATVSAVASQPYTPELKSLHPYIQDSTDESTLDSWLLKVPDMSLIDYCRCITHSFNTGSFKGGYGGKPWGNISSTLLKYVQGITSGEVFIDTAYTLAHNNGPMFNKGMQYQGYTSEFGTVLDVQRSGQMCEAIVGQELSGVSKLTDIISILKDGKDVLEVGSYVDWFKVEALGSLKSYPHKKELQAAKYGDPSNPLGTLKAGAGFEWYPNKFVSIVKREEETA